MVYYRKYRPQTISELDLVSVRERLTTILSAKEIPHAFLFTGPKGLGKTSAARILAKAINCEQNDIGSQMLDNGSKAKNPKSKIQDPRSNIEPCNKCDACVSITKGSNIDVIEIDAASNRGIDEIRDLREKIKYSPASLKTKVYIIDEVHMLTTDAFNALLKTLEEPPSHAMFVLCTTESEKIPSTIASRAFRIDFKKPTKDEILRSLDRISEGEKLNVESGVLDEIFRLSEGSFRDAAKILEELSFISDGKKITLAAFEESFKIAGIEPELLKLLEALSKKDLTQALKILEGFSSRGSDFKVITERLAAMLHDMLLMRSGLPAGSGMNDIPGLPTDDIRKLLDLVNDSYKNIRFSVLPQIPLELVVVGWCIEESQPRLDRGQKSPPKADHPLGEKVLSEAKSEKKESELKANAGNGNFMAALIEAVKKDNHSIAGILRGVRLVSIDDGKVKFETRFKFHRDKLIDSNNLQILEKRASEILNVKANIAVDLVS